MVEIALALAVIGFALVAIIGVLPAGMTVQRENREETIINQEAGYWLEAIRTGSQGLADLPSYVQAITIATTVYQNGTPGSVSTNTYTASSGPNGYALTSGDRIVGLLSTPKYEPAVRGFKSNYIVAYVRSLTGSAAEKPPQSNPDVLDTAFSYKLISEVIPWDVPAGVQPRIPPTVRAQAGMNPVGTNLVHNLYDVRLLFRWPLLPNGTAGSGRQSYRALVGGQLVPTQKQPPHPPYFFRPGSYSYSP